MVKNKKTNTNSSPKRKYAKTNRNIRHNHKVEAIIPEEVPNQQQKAEPFAFLGFPDQPFKAKGGVRVVKIGGKQHKHNVHNRHPFLIDDDDDEEDIHPLRIPLFMPFANFAKREGNEGEDFCTEIVDSLRQNTNTLVDEIKESRKEAKQSSDSLNNNLISALKELQSELKKTFDQNLSKN